MYQENSTDYQLVTKSKLHDTKIQTFRTKLHHTNFTDKNKFFTYKINKSYSNQKQYGTFEIVK